MIILQPPHQSEPSPVLSIMKETKIDIGVLLNKKPANQEKVLSFYKIICVLGNPGTLGQM